jgi:cysteinyl-tRNA synthetase
MITITNTLSGKKESFKPLVDDRVSLYVCGITPYDYAHLGHGRCYVTFDVLYRLLKFLGYKVTYCRNFTDIDDKLLVRAEKEYGDQNRYHEIAQKYIDAYHEDMRALQCLKPDHEPRVTGTIDEIIKFIQGLIDAGKAYIVDGDVYFDIQAYPEYLELSKHKLEDLKAGARVEVNQKKKHPLDFALWKSEPEGTFWKAPWGWGRPGWHIECSAMASKFLGKTIDIHAGGQDLIFPHHENEIAQSQALYDQPFARYWMHNGFVRVNKEKMSKSLGNFFTLRDIFKEFDPMVIRFYLLNHQYRAPLDFTFEDIQTTEKSYRKLVRAFQSLPCPSNIPAQEIRDSRTVEKMLSFLFDDLNTPGMMGVLFQELGALQDNPRELCRVKAFLQHVLGLSLEPLMGKEVEITPEMQQLVEEREKARAEKNWQRADELRDKLKELGYELQDKKLS